MGENTEKYITFPVPIKKELDNGIPITYKIKFIDSFSFMSSSLSNLADNLSEGLHCGKCIDRKSCLDYMSVKDDKLIFRCCECNKKDFNKELIKMFANILRKGFPTIHMNTLIVGKDLMKHHYLIKKLFIVV